MNFIFKINHLYSNFLLTFPLETAVHTFFLFTFPSETAVPEIRVLQRLINTYNMRYFPHHVLLCTSTVHDQSGDICIQGYLRILWIQNTKSSNKDWFFKCYVSCLKLEYFFKSCKTKPLNGYYIQQVAVRWHSKNLYRKNVACRARST